MKGRVFVGISGGVDSTEEYKTEVVDYMIDEYKKGRTPNPDVMCNKQIKFGSFLKWAKARGANFIATGHYARISRKNIFLRQFLAGRDSEKDQSYFLWTLTQDQLKRILFPVGDLEKSEVRKIAKKVGLPVAEKKDSQGICFLGPVDMKAFLKHYIKTKPGDVLNENGKVIGRHQGAELYTIGEHYIGYVVAKDLKKNTITVSPNKISPEREGKIAKLNQINWISDPPELGKIYQARVRYRQPLQKLKIGETLVEFNKPQILAPGQSCVIYDKDIVLGGGVISGVIM